MKVEKRIHHSWVDNTKIGKRRYPNTFGKYQYIYASEKGRISLVELLYTVTTSSEEHWEIYCLEGDLFEDVERFKTKKQAETRIWELIK